MLSYSRDFLTSISTFFLFDPLIVFSSNGFVDNYCVVPVDSAI